MADDQEGRAGSLPQGGPLPLEPDTGARPLGGAGVPAGPPGWGAAAPSGPAPGDAGASPAVPADPWAAGGGMAWAGAEAPTGMPSVGIGGMPWAGADALVATPGAVAGGTGAPGSAGAPEGTGALSGAGPGGTPDASYGAGGPGTGAPGWSVAPARQGRVRWPAVAVVAALIGAAVGAGTTYALGGSKTTEVQHDVSPGPAILEGNASIQTILKHVLPAVVSIDATSSGGAVASPFGSVSGGTQEDQGTGMIVSPDGEVVTNNHVIAGATTITVTLSGRTAPLPATLVATDTADDVALLKIEHESDLPTVSFGDSDTVQVGDAVVAIGNALGLSAGTPTVTQGIISATGRSVQASDTESGTENLTNLFQTDAAINSGNSGGPLVDSAGQVIAMNTAVATSSDGNAPAQGIGFAIPSKEIETLLPALRAGSVPGTQGASTAYLGVDVSDLTQTLRQEYDFVPQSGAVVQQVVSGSPAATAGLDPGDVIVGLNGQSVTSASGLVSAVQAAKPGQTVQITFWRGQAEITVTATLASTSSEPSGSAGGSGG